MRRAVRSSIAITWCCCDDARPNPSRTGAALMQPTLAMTGATGFVGHATLRRAVEAGWHVRALTRRTQEARDGVTWIAGALDRPDSLAEMAVGADALLHIAGVVNVPTRAAFEAGNAVATANVVEAARGAGVRRFVHVSSLAAREPGLSHYGWSKARAETIVEASGLDWTIVRPPAVFGPGDTEMLDLFRMARRGLMLIPARPDVGDLRRRTGAAAGRARGGAPCRRRADLRTRRRPARRLVASRLRARHRPRSRA